jgi:SAM-dependent methyltransferase
MDSFNRKLAELYSQKLASFQASPHEHQASEYPPDVIETISKLEIDSVLKSIPVRSDFSVLDIGAGGGRWTLALADKVALITAIEPSALFEVLKDRTASLTNVQCVRRPFENVELERQYDLAIIYGTLMYVPSEKEAETFIRKAAAAIRDGGYLVLGEALARRRTLLADWKEEDEETFDLVLPRCKYWEVLRPECIYIDICQTNHLRLIFSFESHAPILGRSILWPFINMFGWRFLSCYNRACRNIYGKLRHLLGLRRMRIMIWVKRGAGGA